MQKLNILRMREIVELTGVHRSTIYRWIALKYIPAKNAPHDRPTGRLRSTYEQWVRGRPDI
jgi:predicted DNA-binding transcriptional regulator AlpA